MFAGWLLALRRRIVVLQLLAGRGGVAAIGAGESLMCSAAVGRHQHLLVLFLRQLWMQHVGGAALHPVVHLHHALVALLSRHQLGDHGRVLLVNVRFVGVLAPDRVRLIVALVVRTAPDDLVVLGGVRDLGEGDVRALRSPVVVRSDLLRLAAIRQHGLVETATVFRRVALPLVFVIIHTVNVDDSLIVLSGVPLYLYNVLIRSSLNLGLTVPTTVKNECFLLLRDARVLRGLIFGEHLVLRG